MNALNKHKTSSKDKSRCVLMHISHTTTEQYFHRLNNNTYKWFRMCLCVYYLAFFHPRSTCSKAGHEWGSWYEGQRWKGHAAPRLRSWCAHSFYQGLPRLQKVPAYSPASGRSFPLWYLTEKLFWCYSDGVGHLAECCWPMKENICECVQAWAVWADYYCPTCR